MPGLTAVGDSDSPVRVVVVPSQSSYFAGEPFSVTITFTNTRTFDNPRPAGATAHTHKRGAHSISSAPLARPPTSPGTPRNAATPTFARTKQPDDVPRRRGLVGMGNGKAKEPAPGPPTLPQNTEPLPDLIEQRRRRQLAPKALSVSIAPFTLDDAFAEASSSAPHSQRSFQHVPTTPYTPSPLARTDALPLATSHPHARKQSVLDGDFALDLSGTNAQAFAYTPSSSTSTFSLALDPIAEASAHSPYGSTRSPYPSTPAVGEPTIEPAFVPHTPTAVHTAAYPPRGPSAAHRPAPIGLGHPPTISSSTRPFATSFPPPATELILYSYAQLTGSVILTPVPGAQPAPEQARTLLALRSGLRARAVRGGGSMDISASLHPPVSAPPSATSFPTSPYISSTSPYNSPNIPQGVAPSPRSARSPSHGRSASFSAGLMSILSPSALVGSFGASPSSTPASAKWRANANGGGGAANGAGGGATPYAVYSPRFGGGYGGGGPAGGVDGMEGADEPLPTFEVQPAMLAVDLVLGPGESRSYTYTIHLPDNLPPTFKGRALRFSYELVVGTCRAGPGGASSNSISRIMKVPIRLYNHVSVARSLKPYDLLWPVGRRRDAGMPGTEAVVTEIAVTGERDSKDKSALGRVTQLPSSLPSSNAGHTLSSITQYAKALLASLPDPGKDETVTSEEAIEDDERGLATPTLASLSSGSPSAPGSGSSTSHDVNTAITVDGENMHVNGSSGSVAHSTKEPRPRHIRVETERDKEDEGVPSGCREAVEILTRNPKKCSYDVNKDGVKVAVLTFAKSAYRLGETISGVVELNERSSRARVLKLSATLESHETLPSSISPASSARHLRRSHAEHHAAFTLNTLRTTFALDIPPDASPAFQIRVGTPPTASARAPPTPGGLEWKVRLCLLVGVASETALPGAQGVRFKSLVRDGPRGEWGSAWRATPGSAPRVKPDARAEARARQQQQQAQQNAQSPRGWSRFIVSSLLYGTAGAGAEREYHDGDIMDDDDEDGAGGYDGIIPDPGGGVGRGVDYGGGDDGWREVRMETVECEVPVRIFPGNTAFKALDVVFDV